nr:MAG TPA: hypothetical protein [Bacteriophage sp.]
MFFFIFYLLKKFFVFDIRFTIDCSCFFFPFMI